jgi:MFS transporter, DHA2 family, multidrug resistance protein
MPPLTPAQRAALTVALSLAVFMNVLDLSIANVAVPTIAGELGTSADQGTWVITSFAVRSSGAAFAWLQKFP